MRDSIPQLVDHLFRHQAGRLVSHLVRTLGPASVDLAEDVVQDALVTALRRWPFDGVPGDPAAWLARVSRNKALDILRRQTTLRSKLPALEAQALRVSDAQPFPTRFSDELDDDVLRMIFACCHPSIPIDARGPLTLKLACGFGVTEIAAAFLAQEQTVAQRIVRAKRQLRLGTIEVEVPGPRAIAERVASVLEVLYLVFNEGYAAHRGDNLVRTDLVEEAIRLTRLLASHEAAALPQSHALLSLMLFQGSRLPARVDKEGRLVLLADQDRSLWNRRLIAEGFRHLALASEGEHLSEYHVQAAIAACHVAAARAEDTDWVQILAHYDTLVTHAPSPVAHLNRVVALSMVHGPAAGLEALDALDVKALQDYSLLPATRGELLQQIGRHDDAAEAFARARDLARTEPEQLFLDDRIARLAVLRQ
jgi:RNA polymerase sigma-70 factor (ECF subfamily)